MLKESLKVAEALSAEGIEAELEREYFPNNEKLVNLVKHLLGK